jgi:hypothetical protein
MKQEAKSFLRNHSGGQYFTFLLKPKVPYCINNIPSLHHILNPDPDN